MAVSFIVRERKTKDGAPVAPKEFKEFSLPSIKIGSLAEADELIAAFESIDSADVVAFLKNKTAKFR